MDTFLKIWAVLGPLLAAAASAVWSRHVQVRDRDHEHTREVERLDRADAAKDRDHARAVRLEKFREVKNALAEFMASSHEYVRKQSEYWTDQTNEKHQAASKANDKFIYSCQVVTLLGNEDLAEVAGSLWNATIAMPKSYNVPSDTQYEERLAAYRKARSVFNDSARKYLLSLDIQDV